jgi:AraC family transcriptional regulator
MAMPATKKAIANMNGERISTVVEGRPEPLVSELIASTASAPWSGFLIEEGLTCPGEQKVGQVQKPTIFVASAGHGTTHWISGGDHRVQNIRPGLVCFLSPAQHSERSWLTSRWRFFALSLDPEKFRHHAPRQANSIERALRPYHFCDDEFVANTVSRMFIEAADGCRSGKLFGEALSLALLTYVSVHYAEMDISVDRAYLSNAQKRRVVEYISENLDRDITIIGLASLTGLSASHFSRSFKKEFGISPQRYVMAHRIDRAKMMLIRSDSPVSVIAAELGFCSQSHFTKVFREATGLTPNSFRTRP